MNLPPTVQLAELCELIADSNAYCGMWMEVIKLTAAGRLNPITLAGGSDRKLPSTQYTKAPSSFNRDHLVPYGIVTSWLDIRTLEDSNQGCRIFHRESTAQNYGGA